MVFTMPLAFSRIEKNINGGKEFDHAGGRNDWPAISPDGQWIALSSSREGDYDIYVMNIDGSDVRRLTQSSGLDMRARWSPDANSIVFTSNRDGNQS